MIWRSLHSAVALLGCIASYSAHAQLLTGSVNGTIVFGDTGAPAQDVLVTLLPNSPAPAVDPSSGEYVVRDVPQREDYHAQADASGQFTMTGVPAGEYTVLTYAPGYLSPESSSSGAVLGGAPLPPGDSHEVHIEAGTAQAVSLRLQRGGAVEGTVLFSDGRTAYTSASAAGGVAVNVERRLSDGTLVRTGGAAHTDATGHYLLDGLAPGDYVVFAARPAPMVQTSHGSLGSSGETVFAPSTVRGSQAHVITIQGPGVVSGVNIMLPVSAVHTVSGTVVSNGAPVEGYGLVRLYPTGEPNLSRATPIGVGGQFSFADVPDEQYTLVTEFNPQSEFMGVSDDLQSIRMRMHGAPYTTITADVNVSGADTTQVKLQVTPQAQ